MITTGGLLTGLRSQDREQSWSELRAQQPNRNPPRAQLPTGELRRRRWPSLAGKLSFRSITVAQILHDGRVQSSVGPGTCESLNCVVWICLLCKHRIDPRGRGGGKPGPMGSATTSRPKRSGNGTRVTLQKHAAKVKHYADMLSVNGHRAPPSHYPAAAVGPSGGPCGGRDSQRTRNPQLDLVSSP